MTGFVRVGVAEVRAHVGLGVGQTRRIDGGLI
jgi:hypothetical protein